MSRRRFGQYSEEDERRAERIARIQPLRVARHVRGAPSYAAQGEYSTDTFCLRLQQTLLDEVRRYACVASNIAIERETGVAQSGDVIILTNVTHATAQRIAGEYDPPLLVFDVPRPLERVSATRAHDERRETRFLVYRDSVLDDEGANVCDAYADNVIIRIEVRRRASRHAIVALWFAEERHLEIRDSATSDDQCPSQLEGARIDADVEWQGARYSWYAQLSRFLTYRLHLPPYHTVSYECGFDQSPEEERVGVGLCQTWTWVWVYHRLVHGCSAAAINRGLRDAPFEAIETFKAEASGERPVIRKRYC